MMGLPPTMAFYVQATSRAGRSAVGLVLCALGRHYSRDRSVFHFFDPTHRYVNSLVEPVALNRFSVHGPKKTASGLLAALLLCDWSRDLVRLAPTYSKETNFSNADELRNWLARAPASVETDLRDDLRNAFGLSAPVLDPMLTDSFRDEVDRLFASILSSIRGNAERLLTRAMRPPPPRSFRDIDASVTFGVLGHYSRDEFQLLAGYVDVDADPNDEVVLAEEGGSA